MIRPDSCGARIAGAIRDRRWRSFAAPDFAGWAKVKVAARFLLLELSVTRRPDGINAAVEFARERPEVYGPDPAAAVERILGVRIGGTG